MITSATAGTATSNISAITVTAYPTITVSAQPKDTVVTVGSVAGSLNVTAVSSDGSTILYQWYQTEAYENTGGTPLPGETSSVFTIPTALTVGIYYYYCRLRIENVQGESLVTSPSASARVTCMRFISQYNLSGTSGTAVGTVLDTGAYGNHLVPAGTVEYAAGYPLIGDTGSMLTIQTVSLGGAASYALHMKWTPESYRMQNRILALSDGTDMQYNQTGTSLWFKFEKGGAVLYSETLEANMLTNIKPTGASITDITLDITVASDALTLTASVTNGFGTTVTNTRDCGTITGFTAALLGGVILGNRSAGDRYIGAKLKEFWIAGT